MNKMRWTLTWCFLLVSTAHVLSFDRPKRDLWSLKHILSSKIFGTETIVIQLPSIPKNETSQLFKIKGYDNIYLKVTRKADNAKPGNQKPKDPVIVSPEIAIIGRYLGTTTEGETLLALEIAKNLLKSGILSGERMVEIREPTSSGHVITSERDPIYVLPAIESNQAIEVVNPEPTIAVYPPSYQPVVVANEVKYRPLQTKYSYKQEGESADMKFESFNNNDVIVTRTNKIPNKPRYLALRLTDVASIGANPYQITSYQPNHVITPGRLLPHPGVETVPIYPYFSGNKPQAQEHKVANVEVVKQSDNALNNNLNVKVPKFISNSGRPFDIRDHLGEEEVDTLNTFINAKLEQSKKMDSTPTLNKLNENGVPDLTQDISNYKDYLDANVKYGNLVHRYVYQQMGDGDLEPTVVNIEDPKLNQTVRFVKPSDEVPKDFVYVPPLGADTPPLPSGVPSVNSFQDNSVNDYEVFVDSDPSAPSQVSSSSEASLVTTMATKKKNDGLRLNDNLDATSFTSTYAPDISQFDIEYQSSISTGNTVNKTTTSLYLKTTTSKPKDNLGIIGLNAINEKTGTLKTNIQNKNIGSPKKNPVLQIDPTASTVRNYRPKLRVTSARPYTGGPVY